MSILQLLRNITQGPGSHFKRQALVDSIRQGAGKISEGSLSVLLNRMEAQGSISKVGRGEYQINVELKPEYTYKPDDELLNLNSIIKEHFPFIEYCLWKPAAMSHLMQHIPSAQMILVDVEKVAMESVFYFLQSASLNIPLLLNPSKLECERYLTTSKIIVIRPLITEAPVDIIDNCPVPTIEKMLVDASGDNELEYMHGAELYKIFTNAFEAYDINKNRLLRYASRRNRKSTIDQILNAENL